MPHLREHQHLGGGPGPELLLARSRAPLPSTSTSHEALGLPLLGYRRGDGNLPTNTPLRRTWSGCLTSNAPVVPRQPYEATGGLCRTPHCSVRQARPSLCRGKYLRGTLCTHSLSISPVQPQSRSQQPRVRPTPCSLPSRAGAYHMYSPDSQRQVVHRPSPPLTPTT